MPNKPRSPNPLTARIWLRLLPEERVEIQRAAETRKIYMAEFLRQAALAAAKGRVMT